MKFLDTQIAWWQMPSYDIEDEGLAHSCNTGSWSESSLSLASNCLAFVLPSLSLRLSDPCRICRLYSKGFSTERRQGIDVTDNPISLRGNED